MKQSVQVVYAESAAAAKRLAQEELFEYLRHYQGTPMLLLCSGGSSMDLLDNVPDIALGSWLTLGVTDDRMSTDPKVNNFLQLRETAFGQAAEKAQVRFLSTVPRDGQSIDEWSEDFENALREWVNAHPAGKIVMTLGIGRDGHTIGIMPYPEDPLEFARLFTDSERWTVGYDVGTKNPHRLRLTLAPAFLTKHVDHTIVYHVGEEKRQSLLQVLDANGSFADVPGRIVHQLRDVKIVTEERFRE
ncbi:MAG TPA: 6-phosphogluconolactonase [Patescibacteria group bacterium]